MSNSNLFQCNHCKFFIIAEELETHECKKIKETKFESDIIWINDGEKWYPLKLTSPKSKHPFSTPDDETEPKFAVNYNRKKIDSQVDRDSKYLSNFVRCIYDTGLCD
jgi:hypothetical protein